MHRKYVRILSLTATLFYLPISANLQAETVGSQYDASHLSTDIKHNVPFLTQELTNYHLKHFKGFEEAEVVNYHIMYDPDAKTALYYEAELKSKNGDPSGYIITSATKNDIPIVQFATSGKSYHARLMEKVASISPNNQAHDFKMVRFGAGMVSAEDSDGKLLAFEGIFPSIKSDEYNAIKNTLHGNGEMRDGVLKSKNVVKPPEDIPLINFMYEGARKEDLYPIVKENYSRFMPKNTERLESRWKKTLAKLQLEAKNTEDNTNKTTDDYNYYYPEATATSYFTQIPANTDQNTDGYSTGCGPTAWMNILGWFDFNKDAKMLSWNQKYDSYYTDGLTVDLMDYLGVWESTDDQGATNPWDMDLGYDFLDKLDYATNGYSWAYDMTTLTWETLYKVGREAVITYEVPFIAGYYDDWHYAVGLGLAEDKTGGYDEAAWIWLNPGWYTSNGEDYNFWIDAEYNIFATYSLLGTSGSPWHETPAVADVNGDGKADIITFTQDSNKDVWVALSSGTKFGTSSKWHDSFAPKGYVPMMGDVNGDKKKDIIAFSRGSDKDVYVALSNGTTAFGTSSKWHDDFTWRGEIPLVGDFNGDGKDDIANVIQKDTRSVSVALSNGSSFGTKTTWYSSYFSYDGDVPSVGDVNKDGKADIILFSHDTTGDVKVSLSSGSSFGTPTKWHDWFGPYEEVPMIGDFSGDGIFDAITFTHNSLADVYVVKPNSSKTAFGSSSKWHDSFGTSTETTLVGDVNGDKKWDIIAFTQDSAADVKVSTSTGSKFNTASVWHTYFAP